MLRRSRNTWRIKVATCASILCFLAAGPAYAGTYSSFDSTIELLPDGAFVVSETMTGSFASERHGIFRSIPLRYHGPYGLTQRISVDVLEVARDREPVHYTTYHDGDYLVIKIGDPDLTFSGPFTYQINYSVERAILYGETSDELYWNVSGTQWDERLPSVGAIVLMAGVPANALAAACYTGSRGSIARDCAAQIDDGSVSFSANDFLTISVSFPKGIVPEPTTWIRIGWWLSDNWRLFLLAIPPVTLFWAIRHWWKYGRDPKGRGTIVAQYEPPAGMTPTEMGTLMNARLDGKDFSAAIVHLAVRGYLKMTDHGGKKFTLTRVRESVDGLKPFEAELMDTLFGEKEEVSTKDDAKRFVAARKMVSSIVYSTMAWDGYFVRNPEQTRRNYLIAGLVFAIGSMFIGWFAWVTFPVGIILMLMALAMPKRTEKGQEAYDHARGFKEYLSRAEKYRIHWQEKEGIFEAFLPYAMSFGVARTWTKALAPQISSDWEWYYVGAGSNLGTADFADRMKSIGSAFGEVSAPRSSGGGDSGGGSSGGGFGGGGGGSW